MSELRDLCSHVDLQRGFWTRALHWIYDGALAVALVLGLPYFLFRLATSRRYRTGLRQRFGRVPRRTSERPCLWIHGVSVGEIKAASPLVRAVRDSHPEVEIVLSATTPTGYALARRLYADHLVFYYPLDFSWVVSRTFRRIRPTWVVLVELEIWPNLLRCANRRHVPVAVVNGRISSRSYRGYLRLRSFLPQFSRIALYCVQSEVYCERFRDLGVDPRRLRVTGNVKFDSFGDKLDVRVDDSLRSTFGLDRRDLVVVGGSTHDTEEVQLFETVQALAARGLRLRLILAPRHPERTGDVAQQLKERGAIVRRLTELRRSHEHAQPGELVLVDTIGELERVYALATVVFVGGSLVPTGGHNMLEPAALGKAVLFGPHTFNFDAETELVLSRHAAIAVQDRDGLEQALEHLLRDEGACLEMGERGRAAILENRGATGRTLEALQQHLFDSRRVVRSPARDGAPLGHPAS